MGSGRPRCFLTGPPAPLAPPGPVLSTRRGSSRIGGSGTDTIGGALLQKKNAKYGHGRKYKREKLFGIRRNQSKL